MVDEPMPYFGLVVDHAMWIPAATKAASQGRACGLHKPPGYETIGYTVNYFVQTSGHIRWTLSYKFSKTGKSTRCAHWYTDWIPEQRQRQPQRPIATHGKVVEINKAIAGDFVRKVKVFIDGEGLPYPVPLEVCK